MALSALVCPSGWALAGPRCSEPPTALATDRSRSLRLHTGACLAVLQGLAIRKMYRILAPQVTENPVFMHLTDTTPKGVRKAVDQCAEVGLCAAHARLPPSDPSSSRGSESVVSTTGLSWLSELVV